MEVRVRCIAEWGGSSMRMVLMETVDRRTVFPVIIAENEAGYLTREWMGDEGMKRPGPYDLLSEMLKGFSIELREALIYHLSEGVFMTRMVFASEQHELEVEARISDAVIMAIRSHCPVYVLPEVLEKVGVSSNVLKRMEELVTDDGKGIDILELTADSVSYIVRGCFMSDSKEIIDTIHRGETKEYEDERKCTATIYGDDYDYTIDDRLKIICR